MEIGCVMTIIPIFQMSNVQDARREMTKTKEQLEEEKRISLSIRIKPLDLSEMDSDQVGIRSVRGSHAQMLKCSGFAC